MLPDETDGIHGVPGVGVGAHGAGQLGGEHRAAHHHPAAGGLPAQQRYGALHGRDRGGHQRGKSHHVQLLPAHRLQHLLGLHVFAQVDDLEPDVYKRQAVLRLQQALNQLGYSTGGADGKYGPATQEAVESFQRANNLKVDGIAGNATQTLLYQLTGGATTTPDSGSSSSGSSSSGLFSGNYATLKYGSRGDRVSILQKALNDLGFNAGSVDGNFGAGTQKAVTAFQKSAGLTQDGKAGQNTLTALEPAASGQTTVTPAPDTSTSTPTTDSNGWLVPSRTLRKGYTGDDVKSVQSRLKELGYYTGSLDGNYGSGTMAAVKSFQANNGLTQDGLAGSSTFAKLFSTSAVSAGSSSGSSSSTDDDGWLIPSRTLRKGCLLYTSRCV